MGLFNKKEGGMMDVIRCDEQEYLVWKWRPAGQDVNSTHKENAIRYNSSLRVKDGEVAVFVYKQNNGPLQDFIVGPFDDTIKTANFPVLTSIVGLAFGGSSPFQAEIYFINLAGNVQLKFGIPYFDVFDPRFLDFAVPMAVRGTITFNITDYKGFIKLNRLINFELEDLKRQIKDAVAKYVKSAVTNLPSDNGIPVLQIERKILDINAIIEQYLRPRLEADFGVNLKGPDIAAIEPDKESRGYAELRRVTAEQSAKTIEAQTQINIKNMADTQAINAANMEETLRIQREEAQRAQRLQTESNFMGAHDGWRHGSADGRHDVQYGTDHEPSHDHASSRAAGAVHAECQRTEHGTLQPPADAADGAERPDDRPDLRMEAGHGQLGSRRQRPRACLALRRRASSPSSHASCTTTNVNKENYTTL